MDLDLFFAEMPMSVNTRILYRAVLVRFLRAVDPSACGAGDVIRFLDSTKWGDSMRYTAAVAIRKYIRWACGDQHLALRVRVRRGKSRPGRSLTAEQAGRLLASFDSATRKGRRDLAICCLALDTGLRVAELASAKYIDLDLADRKLLVKVKGGQWTYAIYSEYTAAHLATWLPHRKAGDDRLFQITRDGLRVTVRRWGERLGFRMSAHDLRRTFAVLSLRAGAPTRLVQVAGRWSDISMVERYSQAITPSDFSPYFPVARLNDS